MNTLTTCKQYAGPVVKGKDVLTTRTDFVNKHQSVLQTTCYNFTGTATTQELAAGIVKAHGLHWKNPVQHITDFRMLSIKDDFSPAFRGAPKMFDCIRVDGATDEGLSHEEVQFVWTEWHYNYGKRSWNTSYCKKQWFKLSEPC